MEIWPHIFSSFTSRSPERIFHSLMDHVSSGERFSQNESHSKIGGLYMCCIVFEEVVAIGKSDVDKRYTYAHTHTNVLDESSHICMKYHQQKYQGLVTSSKLNVS